MYCLLLFGIIWAIINGLGLIFFSMIALSALGFLFYALMDKLKVNGNYKIFVGLAVWLNALSYVYFYQKYLFSGYPMHFIDSILITCIIYDYLKKNIKARKIYVFVFVFLTVVGILSMWEVYEYLADVILHIHLQGLIA